MSFGDKTRCILSRSAPLVFVCSFDLIDESSFVQSFAPQLMSCIFFTEFLSWKRRKSLFFMVVFSYEKEEKIQQK